MNRRDRGILIGMGLGDGCIKTLRKQKSGKTVAAQIQIAHSMKQLEYLEHKSELLRSIFGGVHTVRIAEYYQKTLKRMYKQCMVSKSNPYFKQLYKLMYPYGKKTYTRRMLDMISPQGIALWYMDDGSLTFTYKADGSISGCFFRISTYCSEDEVDIICDYFKEVHRMELRKHYCKRTKLWTVGGRTKVFNQFKTLIDKYIIPSMRYKLEPITKPDGQERIAPHGVCKECKNDVKKLIAGLCTTCRSRKNRLSHGDNLKLCPTCKVESYARNFGTVSECCTCYQKRRRKGDDIVQSNTK